VTILVVVAAMVVAVMVLAVVCGGVSDTCHRGIGGDSGCASGHSGGSDDSGFYLQGGRVVDKAPSSFTWNKYSI
jgi:hypothetical protein